MTEVKTTTSTTNHYNGKVASETCYFENEHKITTYYNDGVIASVKQYQDNQLHGTIISQYIIDKVISRTTQEYVRGKRHGLYTRYRPDGKTIHSTTEYDNDVIVQFISYSLDGKVACITEYINGKADVTTWYNPDNTIRATTMPIKF